MSNLEHQRAVYSRRFDGIEEHRIKVWRALNRYYFHQWIKPTDTVIDLGAGYCEFINSVSAAHKYALDANPATADKAAPDVQVFSQQATDPWPLPAESANVVFSSNFFEHLPTKHDLDNCLSEAYRVLGRQGLLIALGPNIRFCCNEYWDFWDHHLPLSDRSLVEALEVAGFRRELVVPRFLPLTMRYQVPQWTFLIRLYLLLPLAQRLWGKQFLVIARKPQR